MATPSYIQTLLKNAKTQTKDTAGAELVAIAKGSFDKLSFEIVEKQNRVVACEGALNRFELAVEKEREELEGDLHTASADLAHAREAWEAMVEARGLRGMQPVAVERTCKLSD